MAKPRAATPAPPPLLETKLHVPQWRAGSVSRPRLLQRLDRGVESKLTLVSAPAGFGKSTLLAEWLASRSSPERTIAWVSLDAADNQAVTFWTYVFAAVQRAQSEVGASGLARLRDDPTAPIEPALTVLLNELSGVTNTVVLVLDDYHLIETREIHEGLAFLLDHLPPRLHVVIATRSDPAMPLARMRGRGELTEVRAADLRFTPEEAAAYLNEVMRLDLAAADIEALESRTEGWIAALQMAALSMQGRDDVANFIAGFAGDDRYVVDYLAEEVLQRQPEHVRDFLLETSILERLSGDLCDAVTGIEGGKSLLEQLERGNLFLVPLDGRRQWYRYHHLFADVLRTRLLDEQPDVVPELHRRACEWHEHHDQRPEAVRHALAARDFERAADLIELALPELGRNRQEALRLQWLEALPDDVLRMRPVLSNEYAGSFLQRGELGGVEARLRDAERWFEFPEDKVEPRGLRRAGMVVASEPAARGLAGRIAIHRAGQALLSGDVPGTIAHAQRALDLASEDDDLTRGGAAALQGLAYWTQGDLKAASASYAEGIPALVRAGHLSDAIGCTLALADIRLTQGRLTEAMNTCERSLSLAVEPGTPARRGAADMHVALAEILRERNELADAERHLRAACDLDEGNGLPQSRYRAPAAEAGIRVAEGDVEAGIALLGEAERQYFGDFSPNVRPVAARRAKLLVSVGRLPEAMAWARESGLSASDELGYVREFEHLTLARVLLAEAQRTGSDSGTREVLQLLERLLGEAESGGRTGSVIEVLVVQALALDAAKDAAKALSTLERALLLAEPEGYVRIFADEGPPIAKLLASATKKPVGAAYARRLLDAMDVVSRDASESSKPSGVLSERELDVLRLLRSDLSGPDIANELVVSLNTLRTHTKSIYSKLGVGSRRAAVRRAAELGLLP